MGYDRIFAILAKRAVAHGIADAAAFVELQAASGVSAEEIGRALEDDLANNGPIFGKFIRSLSDAAVSSVRSAEAAGAVVGGMDEADLDEALRLAGLDDEDFLIDEADPDVLDDFGDKAANQPLMWVSMLEKTCYRCLPLHGTIRTRGEWQAVGLHPTVMHDGWNSSCKCRLVPADDVDRDTVMAPLSRVKAVGKDGRAIRGRTARQVAQIDPGKSINAVQEAQRTPEGRAILRRLGAANG